MLKYVRLVELCALKKSTLVLKTKLCLKIEKFRYSGRCKPEEKKCFSKENKLEELFTGFKEKFYSLLEKDPF